MTDCLVCSGNPRADLPPRERVVVTDHWRVAHAYDTTLTGRLVLDAPEHVTALDELPPAAPTELGELLGRLTPALRAARPGYGQPPPPADTFRGTVRTGTEGRRTP